MLCSSWNWCFLVHTDACQEADRSAALAPAANFALVCYCYYLITSPLPFPAAIYHPSACYLRVIDGGDRVVTHAWEEWGIQALVLLSFTLQVTLLILAEFRRRTDSGFLRVVVWSAYMLADATAIYVLGHLSVTSRSPEHELAAFWAGLLLLHLGGQDNITAYGIEDNQLWLRHLQTLALQVAAAGYVLYQASMFVGSQYSLLRPASILIFLVGVLKYGERVWALKCAGSSPMGKNYRKLEPKSRIFKLDYYLDHLIRGPEGPRDTEAYLLMAHRMLDVPKEVLKGLPNENGYLLAPQWPVKKVLYKVVEMQLSLMHDVFYTKVEMVHSNLYTLCIRIIPALATAATLLLFHLEMLGDRNRSNDKGYSRLDVAVTYALLVGAVILEAGSLLGAMFSSWTCPLLVRWSRDHRGMKHQTPCNFLGRELMSLRRLVHAADWRRSWSWSRSMGQHNLFRLCTQSRASRSSKIARWMGAEDWWNTQAYTSSIPVSASIQELLLDQVFKSFRDTSEKRPDPNKLFDLRGKAELERWGLYESHQGLDYWPLTWSLEEKILVWHIATDIYLTCSYKKQPNQEPNKTEAVETLSNYMMFLLAARPYMLAPTASRKVYIEMCYALTAGAPQCANSGEDLLTRLHEWGCISHTEFMVDPHSYGSTMEEALDNFGECMTNILSGKYDFNSVPFTDHCTLILKIASDVGAKLIKEQQDPADTLELIAQVWVEILCYASRQCSAFSHAKQLSNGSEFITVAALLVEYFKQNIVPLGKPSSTSSSGEVVDEFDEPP